MANTFHVSMYVQDLDAAIARYRKILGAEPAKVRRGYAKFESRKIGEALARGRTERRAP
jgi:catechol 2,3-dioxygenase-like lactoylglutathione lyase family enzyme